jgi:hypothetical protein
MIFPPLPAILLALLVTLPGALAFAPHFRMNGRRPALLKLAPHVPADAVTRALEALKLVVRALEIVVAGVVTVEVLGLVKKQRELRKATREQRPMQERVDVVRAELQRLIWDVRWRRADVQQHLCRVFALVEQVGVGGLLHQRRLFIMIPWTKSGLSTLNTQPRTGIFSKSHFILLSNSVYGLSGTGHSSR